MWGGPGGHRSRWPPAECQAAYRLPGSRGHAADPDRRGADPSGAGASGASAMSLRGDLNLYGRVLREARPHLAKIAGIFALDLLASPLGLLTPLPLKIAVDSAIGGHPLP